jgi:hypothetical protein
VYDVTRPTASVFHAHPSFDIFSTTLFLQCTAYSFLDFDWSNGDVVFANSTCFTEDLMTTLALQGESLKPGAFLITFTKGLDSKAFKVR